MVLKSDIYSFILSNYRITSTPLNEIERKYSIPSIRLNSYSFKYCVYPKCSREYQGNTIKVKVVWKRKIGTFFTINWVCNDTWSCANENLLVVLPSFLAIIHCILIYIDSLLYSHGSLQNSNHALKLSIRSRRFIK